MCSWRAEKALQEVPLTRSWGKTTVTLEPVGRCRLDYPFLERELVFILSAKSCIRPRRRLYGGH